MWTSQSSFDKPLKEKFNEVVKELFMFIYLFIYLSQVMVIKPVNTNIWIWNNIFCQGRPAEEFRNSLLGQPRQSPKPFKAINSQLLDKKEKNRESANELASLSSRKFNLSR